jgi:hypothetical protein
MMVKIVLSNIKISIPGICRFIILPVFLIYLLMSCGDRASDSRNQPPAVPLNPSPADGAIDQVLDVQLSWECPDPDGDDLIFDLYFGTVMNPPLIDHDMTSSNFVLDSLEESTYYYWKIVARDEFNRETEGPLWWFTTGPIPQVHLVTTYKHHQEIYNYWVEDGLVYLVAEEGLDIVNVLGLAEPTVIGTYVPADTGVYIYNVFIRDTYAYLSMCFGGMQIIDISDPSNPVFVGDYSWDYPSCATSIFVEDNYAYVADGSTADLYIVDVSNPESPIPIGYFDFPWTQMVGWKVIVSGSYAYYRIASVYGGNDMIIVIDASDPTNPIQLTYISTYYSTNNFFVAGDYLYVPCAGEGVLRIFDISQPSSPEVVSVYPGERLTVGVFVQDDYAYVIAGQSDLHVLDVTDPTNPEFITGYATQRQAYQIFVDGAYIYLFDVGNLSEDFHILRFVH